MRFSLVFSGICLHEAIFPVFLTSSLKIGTFFFRLVPNSTHYLAESTLILVKTSGTPTRVLAIKLDYKLNLITWIAVLLIEIVIEHCDYF